MVIWVVEGIPDKVIPAGLQPLDIAYDIARFLDFWGLNPEPNTHKHEPAPSAAAPSKAWALAQPLDCTSRRTGEQSMGWGREGGR